jgi:hypothetical protein
VCCDRTTVSGRTAAPSQRIEVERAIRAVTIEAAYCINKENEIGSIKPGEKADFTILEADPFAVEISQLKDISVWGCVFEGRKFEVPKEGTKATIPTTNNYQLEEVDLASIGRLRG